MVTSGKADRATLVQWLAAWIRHEMRMPSDPDPEAVMVTFGMDSVNAVMLVGDLEDYLGRRLPPTLLWDFPTIDQLATHLVSGDQRDSDASSPEDDRQILSELDQLSEDEIDRLLKERLAEGQGG